MKKTFALLCALLLVSSAFADPYFMAKQQAKRTADVNNAEQARIQRNTADTTAPADPALQTTVQNITDLTANLAAFGSAEKPDAAQKAALMNNLTTAAQGKKAPSDAVKKFAEDLSVALAGNKKITAAQQKQLGTFVHAAFNGSHLTPAQADKIVETVQKILTDAAVPVAAVVNVVGDFKKIISETK